MGLGAYPASDPQWLGMLGMHGTYEANNAMHDCDVMVCIGARFDDRITGRLDAFSPGSKKIHIDIDPSSINKNIRVDMPIVGDVAAGAGGHARRLEGREAEGRQGGAEGLVGADRALAGAELPRLPARTADVIMPQYAIERLYAATKDKDVYITTEVGQHQMWAAQFFHFEEPNRWMTSGGLGTMGYGLPAAVGVQVAHPEQPGHRHRRRRLGADDHAGDVDGGSARPADQDLHPQQPVHGHGPPVAAAPPRQPPVALLHGFAARLREARRGLWLRRHPRREAGRARRRDRRDDQGQAAGDLRLPRRGARQLLPDDPLGQGAQRDAARPDEASDEDDRQGDRRGGKVLV